MRIAYMFSGLGSLSGKTNGILTQALTWACELRKIGVEVDLISPWDGYDFSACDIVHFFSYGAAQEVGFAQLKNKFNVRIAISPIIDTNRSAWKSRMASMLHFPMLHSYSLMGSLRASRQWVDGWFVRSEYEGEHISHALNIPTDKIFKVMLSTRLPVVDKVVQRQSFCLLVCFLPSARKNVMRLIDAAIKYGFNLKLAGSRENEAAYEKMLKKIEGHDNIEVLGRVSDAELLSLYRTARVFALPSLMEGVGLVALEAAANGCDIVLTNRGAPKEYYNGMATLVDPLSVDQIGQAVMEFLGGKTYQPNLKEHIAANYTSSRAATELKMTYQRILSDK